MRLVNVLKKDLQEHGRLLMALLFAMALALLLLFLVFRSSQTVLSVLEIARSFCSSLIPIAALVLGQRLIVSEYMGHTIRFLEAFPVSRFSVLLSKYLLGLVFLLFVTWSVLAAVIVMSLATENMDSRFALILALRTGVAVHVVWSIVFCFSFFGSLKTPLYVVLLVIVYIVQTQTQWDMTEHGPGGLLSSRLFAYESYDLPWLGIVESLFLALLFSLIGFAVALCREGRFVTHFARNMDRKEYVTLIILVLASLTLLQLLEGRDSHVPFRFSSESVLRSNTLPLSIQYSDEKLLPIAQQQLAELEIMLRKLQWFLGGIDFPRVRLSIEPAGNYPANIGSAAALAGFGRLRTEEVDGVLLTSNLDLNNLQQRARLHSRLLQELFISLTNSRASFEPSAWLMYGFSWWWALHWNDERFFNASELASWNALTVVNGKPAADVRRTALNIAADLQLLSAVFFHVTYAVESAVVGDEVEPSSGNGFDRSLLFELWNTTLETYGHSAGAALSYSLIENVLSNQSETPGVDAVFDRALLRKMLSQVLVFDASVTSSVTVQTVLNPLSNRLASATGRSFDEIYNAWHSTLASRVTELLTQPRQDSSDLLHRLSSDAGFVSLLRNTSGSDSLADKLNSLSLIVQSSQCYMLYQSITAFDQHIKQHELYSEDVSCKTNLTDFVVDKGYSNGERVFVALELVSEELWLPLRLNAARLVIE